MRFLLYAPPRTSAIAPSSAISIAAHVTLFGLAIYGSGVRNVDVEDPQTNAVYYLPPPDRHPSSNPAIEHLQYVELGTGLSPVGKPNPGGAPPAETGVTESSRAGGNPGTDVQSQAPSPALESPDSVFSILDVEESAVRSQESAAPAYPPDLVKNGVEGGVFIRFVVDTTGRPDPESFQVVTATNPAFAQSVKDALPQMKFTPATVRGHHVRQAVEQNFQFKLQAMPQGNLMKPQPIS
ncbi:MAG: TonB family protein [bacterium]